MQRTALLLSLTLAALIGVGCSHVISREARDAVDGDASFAQVKAAPGSYLDRRLLLGGLIVDNRVGQDGSTLEVFRWTLDRWGEPVAVDEAGGRFLAVSDRLLDPALYAPGRLLTLAATVVGEESRPLGEVLYRYPVLQVEETYLWETPFRYGIHPSPNIYVPYYVGPESFGRTSPYDPGYHAYPYTPYWLRPPGR